MSYLILIVASLGALCFFISRRPSEFRVSRQTLIPASPEVVFNQVNNLRSWKDWSPWAKLDPNARESFEGQGEGNGAIMHWSGNNKVGEGRMTITESLPDKLIKMRLQFIRPFKATNAAEFNFEPQGENTAVVWTMSGTNNFMAKAVGLFMDCEKMVGSQFETGLGQLSSVSQIAQKQ